LQAGKSIRHRFEKGHLPPRSTSPGGGRFIALYKEQGGINIGGMNMVWVVRAELKDGYKVYVEFNDGVKGIIDFKEILENEPLEFFRKLLDLEVFRTVHVDIDTLCWDNGLDFAPEYLYEQVKVKANVA
jgi:hypothetical protein